MKYGIVGHTGRMGQELQKVFGEAGCSLVLTSNKQGGTCDTSPDVIVDFSSFDALPGTVGLCRKHRSGLVMGTTALKAQHFELLQDLGCELPVVQSFNFAIGVNVLKMILRDYAPFFQDWDMEISETHHNKKKDAPSGTALLLQDATGRDCPTHSLRLGGVPGDHSVQFGNEGEVVTFTHRALSRTVFALGALRAAHFIASAPAGLYSFEDVLETIRLSKDS
ncbi:MAG: 4-hydroxy-tetrahydrodipicolinate reductase [Fretibacterium sp.]|nr:4-hydroxy-tetrahydrodipicolinate reductase [Fretibacterium sp.]